MNEESVKLIVGILIMSVSVGLMLWMIANGVALMVSKWKRRSNRIKRDAIEQFKERTKNTFLFGTWKPQPMQQVPAEKCGAAWPVSVPVVPDVNQWQNLPGCPSQSIAIEGSTRVVALAVKQTEAPPLSMAEMMDMLKSMQALRGDEATIEIEVSERALREQGARIVGNGRIMIGGHVFRYRHLVGKGTELK